MILIFNMKRTFNLILTLAVMLTMAQTAWAIDPVTKTISFSTAERSSDQLSIIATDPDDNTAKSVITANGTTNDIGITSNLKISNKTSSSSTGAEVSLFISPYVNGKVTKIEFTSVSRVARVNNGTFSMSIDDMKYNGTDATLTGNVSEYESVIFISNSTEGIAGNLTMRLGVDAVFQINNSSCQMIITYIPSAAPTHSHNFSFNAVGNTLTATCGHSDGLTCSLADAGYTATLTLTPPTESFYRPGTYYSASHNLPAFNTQTGLNGTTDGIRYTTDGTNYTSDAPNAVGDYTARLIVTIGSTNYTLTQSFRVVAYSDIKNIYPQFNISTDDYASTTMAGEGQTVTITFTPKFGETLTSLTVTGATTNYSIGSGITDNGSNTYTFTMPAENVTIGATFSISGDDFAESGTNEYTIKTANGWGWFCFATNYDLAPYGFSGKVVKLAGNVSSSEMAGKSGHPFKGTFDGQGNTLTFNLQASEGNSAPFHYTDGATISNLHVTGLIEGNDISSLAGLVGKATGNLTISNCHVSTQISTTVSISAWHGGIIAFWDDSNVNCTITGCVYDGLIYNPNEANVTSYCFGFIGNSYGSNMDITFTDCLFAPAEYTNDKKALREDYGSHTFVYPKSGLIFHVTNCYYTRNLGRKQGRPATTATTAPANLGAATTDHGMVKGYENGFLYNGNYYTPKYGDVVVEYPFDDDEERASVTINGTNDDQTGVNLVGVNITEDIEKVSSVNYNRKFTSGQAATVILPFNYTCNDSEGSEGGKFYGFKEVTYDYDQHIWVCTMKEPGNTAATSLTANTPYLFMPSETKMKFPNISSMTGGVVTLLPTTANDGLYGGATTDYDWNFYGTYKGKTWTETSKDYGFAAQGGTAVHGEEVVAGQFVRFTTNAFIKPMRCYLSYVGTEAPAPARGLTRSAAATDDLPQSITVRLVSRNGETTAIGEIDTTTGRMTFDSEAWYTLDGVRLSGKPSSKGIYINNGKKVAIK